jgi:hypothetical protein
MNLLVRAIVKTRARERGGGGAGRERGRERAKYTAFTDQFIYYCGNLITALIKKHTPLLSSTSWRLFLYIYILYIYIYIATPRHAAPAHPPIPPTTPRPTRRQPLQTPTTQPKERAQGAEQALLLGYPIKAGILLHHTAKVNTPRPRAGPPPRLPNQSRHPPPPHSQSKHPKAQSRHPLPRSHNVTPDQRRPTSGTRKETGARTHQLRPTNSCAKWREFRRRERI